MQTKKPATKRKKAKKILAKAHTTRTPPKQKSAPDTFYHLSWDTESCDRGGIFFREKPSDEFLESFMRREFPWEFEDGHRTIYWTVNKAEFEDD